MLYAGQNTGEAVGDQMISVENLIGSDFNDDLRGTGGANLVGGGAGNDFIRGRGGNDTITGDSGNDTLLGQDGNDTLVGGLGGDTMNGGNGTDTADYSAASAGLRVDMLYAGQSNGEATGDQMISIENLAGSGFNDDLRGTNGANLIEAGAGDDFVRGRGGNDTVEGGAGNDTLLGQDGNDVLVGGLGGDTMNGGNGVDTADYSGASAGLRVDMLYAGQNNGEATGDLMLNMENLTGSAFNDDLRGTGGANDIGGGAGNDLIRGRGGDDTIGGGAGNDTLLGQAGADTFVFTSGADVMQDFEDNVDTLQIDASLVAPGTTAQDLITNFADDSSGMTVIDLGGGNVITVSTIATAQDLVDDIVFV